MDSGRKGRSSKRGRVSQKDYMAVYRSHFVNKMDISVFDSKPRKLPPAPKRSRISSYRCSLGSLYHVGHVKAVRGRISRRHRPIRQARVGNVFRTETAVSSCSREQSPEI